MVCLLVPGQDGGLPHQRGLAADVVDTPTLGDGRDPAGRIVGDSLLRPAAQRLDEGILNRFLGQVDVAESSGQPGEDHGIRLPEHRLDDILVVYRAHPSQVSSPTSPKMSNKTTPGRLLTPILAAVPLPIPEPKIDPGAFVARGPTFMAM